MKRISSSVIPAPQRELLLPSVLVPLFFVKLFARHKTKRIALVIVLLGLG